MEEQTIPTKKELEQSLKLRELDLTMIDADYKRKRTEIEQDIENLKEFIKKNK